MLIPSIDLMNGKAVQLRQGKTLELTSEKSPHELFSDFHRCGDVAVIDLDAALSQGDNLPLIKELCRLGTVRVGGGIRTVERGKELLRAGADRLIIGTSATPEFLKHFPPSKIMVAIDHKGGEVVDKGWTHNTGESLFDRAHKLAPYCSGYLCTFVETEGTLVGMDQQAVTFIREKLPHPVTIAGGIATTEEASALCRTGVDIQVGMALYTGKLNLPKAFIGSLDFDKFPDKLIPTIVQDTAGQVLMLAYSSPESLEAALNNGRGIYYSRSRQNLWEKGASSGHTQALLSARTDCDRDALLFVVQQKKAACHTESYSCFGSHKEAPKFSMTALYETLKRRKAAMPAESYTTKLLTDRKLLNEKLLEETHEVINYRDLDNLKWEEGDLLYFMSVLAVAEGLNWSDIMNELGGRHG
jgi:phosphoribosyl-AMP cyclohydrolase / phosphoribosyl-ATP pyrophosphohydrolase